MKSLLKIELCRAFKNPMLLVSLLVGCGVAIVHIFTNVIPASKWLPAVALSGESPHSVFNNAMGFTAYSIESIIFMYIFPILAALPFADSFYTDVKSGFVKNVFIRTQKSNYLAAKYVSVFLSAGVAVVIPLMINLIITAAILPSVLPEPYTSGFPIGLNGMWSGLYFTDPYLYVFLYFILDFVLAGILACAALAMSFIVSNRFIVLLSPFVICIFLHMIGGVTGFSKIDVLAFVLPVQIAANLNAFAVVGWALVLALPTAAAFFVKGKKNETF